MAACPSYATAFPAIPRKDGIAAFSLGKAGAVEASAKVVFVAKEDMKNYMPAGSEAAVADAEKEGVVVKYEGAGRVVAVAMGSSKKLTLEGLRKAVVSAVAKLKALKVPSAELSVPGIPGACPKKTVEAVVQAAGLANYHFDRYLTTPEKKTSLVGAFTLTAGAGFEGEIDEATFNTAKVLMEATVFARDLGNERADEMHPTRLEEVALAVAAEAGMETHVVRGEELLAQGLHLMYSVGQAARHPPRYVELAYKGDPEHPDDVIMIVGKGVCYDSGGINLKPTGACEDMHMDMCGAAATLGTAVATAKLGIKRNVVFIIGAVENSIDALAYKPHNIVRSHKGLTVEINNTDAEGRLVLADALSLGQTRHKPHTILDMATLTGACVIALGEYAAGCFSNSASLASAVVAAGSARAEKLWHMPILPEHKEELLGCPFADLRSTGAGRMGGACTAAAFLANFIGSNEEGAVKPAYAHIDLAGPAMYSADRGFMKKGATGFGVHTCVSYLLSAPAGAAHSVDA